MKQNKTLLVFDEVLSGHHLEYIHHLYLGAKEFQNIRLIFAVPKTFSEMKEKLSWEEQSNVLFHFIEEKELNEIEGNTFMLSYKKCALADEIAKIYSADEIFFISLMNCLPSVIFRCRNKIKISGIVYLIYLYRWNNSNWILKLEDIVKYCIFKYCKRFKSIYLLNDDISPRYLNKKFDTNIFLSLIDPVMPFISPPDTTWRNKLGISPEKKIFLHTGSLSERKGTLNILKALLLLPDELLSKYTIVFAGKVGIDIFDSFYEMCKQLQSKVELFVYDEFCDFESIISMCACADFILIPYQNVESSSGIIGYASSTCTPVVAPKNGLLGKLVRKYKLGILLEDSTVPSLKSFFQEAYSYKLKINSSYHQERTVDLFARTIFQKYV